jgi:hypothetical protein
MKKHHRLLLLVTFISLNIYAQKEIKGITYNDGSIDYSVISSFLPFPLIDITESFVPIYQRNTFPSSILTGVWRTAGNIGRIPERIDDILTSPNMRLQ